MCCILCMCIMATEHDPSDTKLFHVPIIINEKSYNMCIYINNLDTHGSPALMVVPFPKSNKYPIGMIDISDFNMKIFRENIIDLCKPKMKSRGYGMENSLGLNNDDSLQVHKIGNYNISIANNMSQLLNRVDWNVFGKPANFEERMSVLDDNKLYPFDCCYVVAQAIENIKDDGFGIVYKNIGIDYIPTAHEFTGGKHEYNVKCYHFSTVLNDTIPLSQFETSSQPNPSQSNSSNTYQQRFMNDYDYSNVRWDDNFGRINHFDRSHDFDRPSNFNQYGTRSNKLKCEKHNSDYDKEQIKKACKLIQGHQVKMEDNTYKKIHIPLIECINYIDIDGYYRNANICIKNNNLHINHIETKQSVHSHPSHSGDHVGTKVKKRSNYQADHGSKSESCVIA
jgi:hypothetical protein